MGPLFGSIRVMNKLQCILCEEPRKPRKDRPGKFYPRCVTHHREYINEKVRESYQRNREKRLQARRERYWENPEREREIVRRSQAKPEAQARRREYMQTYRRPWRAFVGLVCEECGFKAVDKRQMDVHHLDGDKTNNDPSNLQTLCPPCHRLIPV